MSFQVIKYDVKDFDKWNSFVDNSCNGTLFHRLDFLKYHKDKFTEFEHHLMFLKGETLVAVMPMAIFKEGLKNIARSPYGGSYGGLVFNKTMNLADSMAIIHELKEYLKTQLIHELFLTEAPLVYSDGFSENLKYALLQGGFVLYEADLCSIAKVPDNPEEALKNLQSRARSTVRKFRNNFDIQDDVSVEEFYPILLEDKLRLDATPTHSLDELKSLKELFPNDIIMDIAIHKETGARAGNCYFRNKKTIDSTFLFVTRRCCLET